MLHLLRSQLLDQLPLLHNSVSESPQLLLLVGCGRIWLAALLCAQLLQISFERSSHAHREYRILTGHTAAVYAHLPLELADK